MYSSGMAVLEQLRPAMAAQRAGDTIVRDVRVEQGTDSFGEEALTIVLVLSDPPAGRETWPVEDLRALRDGLREILAPHLDSLGMAWYVAFEPEHPELDDSDDPQAQLDI